LYIQKRGFEELKRKKKKVLNLENDRGKIDCEEDYGHGS